jgi:hypothetical protein
MPDAISHPAGTGSEEAYIPGETPLRNTMEPEPTGKVSIDPSVLLVFLGVIPAVRMRNRRR